MIIPKKLIEKNILIVNKKPIKIERKQWYLVKFGSSYYYFYDIEIFLLNGKICLKVETINTVDDLKNRTVGRKRILSANLLLSIEKTDANSTEINSDITLEEFTNACKILKRRY